MRVDTGYAYGLLMNTCEFDRACSRLQHVFFPQVYCYTFVTVNSGSRDLSDMNRVKTTQNSLTMVFGGNHKQ